MKKILLNLFLLTYTFTTFSQTVSVRILDNIEKKFFTVTRTGK